MMKYKLFYVILLLGYGCSDPVQFTAVFRGDSPVFFSVTKVDINEGDVSPFTVVLSKEPTAEVQITLSVSDSSQIELDPATVVFTVDNYKTPQTIRVIGKDDCLADGMQSVSIDTVSITSSDSNYNNIPNVSIPVDVSDSTDNLPRIRFLQSSESLITSELGSIAFFKVNISCPPTANVNIPLVIDKPTEISVDQPNLLFNPDNYSAYQTVAITGLNDCKFDADQTFVIKSGDVISTDVRFSRYNTVDGISESVSGTNLNYAVANDTVITLPTGSMDMTLAWNSGVAAHIDPFLNFSVSLTCPVTSTVYFGFSFTKFNNKNFGTVANTTLGNTYLTFNPDNWSTPQNVLIQLNSAVTPGELQTGGYPATAPFTDNTISNIVLYESQGDVAQTAVTSPVYTSKTITPNITVNSW